MNKSTSRRIQVFVALMVLANLFLLVATFEFRERANSLDIDFAKEFANEIVSDLQLLASELGVAGRSNVKGALAQLHYDVYLAGNRVELAGLLQNSASAVRNLIISEKISVNGEQALRILNESRQVQTGDIHMELKLDPAPTGGYLVDERYTFEESVVSELNELETLFSFDRFKPHFEAYRSTASLDIVIEDGLAQLSSPEVIQDTISYYEEQIQNLRTEYADIAQRAGMSEISGQGITMTFNDKLYSMNARDLRYIVSELYSAGAKAICLDGQRLAVDSYIVDTQGGIRVDDIPISGNPLYVEAVGDPETMISSMDLLLNVMMNDFYSTKIDWEEHLVLPGKTQ